MFRSGEEGGGGVLAYSVYGKNYPTFSADAKGIAQTPLTSSPVS